MKILYIIQRYLPFFDTVGLVLYHQLKGGLKEVECKKIYFASGYMIVIGMACSELILTVRAWAVWNQDRRLTIFLPIAYALFWLPNFVFLTIFLRSLKFTDLPYPLVGCFVTSADHILIMCWVVVLIWDAIILGLMAVPGIRAFKAGGNTALTRVVFRDGALYYFYLFLLSSVNISIAAVLPAQYSQLLTSTARCFHSMLTSRVLLHIRAHTSDADPVFRQDVDIANELDSLNLLRSQQGSRPTLIRVPRFA
ncbi:hypothetical protein BDN70DRAFT_296781 [Pholiota conissans]|uniref:Uncharacterized protein n=1 Tax=Pholiota conissans TaxID=109636 RepID=A0A9P5YS04_9AGAR|nr:hypothetical protein BDN70DRAFT_296781 [Pholiota conissans]